MRQEVTIAVVVIDPNNQNNINVPPIVSMGGKLMVMNREEFYNYYRPSLKGICGHTETEKQI